MKSLYTYLVTILFSCSLLNAQTELAKSQAAKAEIVRIMTAQYSQSIKVVLLK